MRYMSLTFVILLGSLLFACGGNSPSTPDTAVEEKSILAIGDSILDWNRSANSSIPAVVGQQLNRPVTNASVSGARISDPQSPSENIGRQFSDRGWDWVIADGGGNDLINECQCSSCAADLDILISENGQSGEIPDLILDITATGTKVMWLYYYDTPERSVFKPCSDEFTIFKTRMDKLIASNNLLWSVSASEVVAPQNPELYDADLVHPSISGSIAIGEQIAQAILDVESK